MAQGFLFLVGVKPNVCWRSWVSSWVAGEKAQNPWSQTLGFDGHALETGPSANGLAALRRLGKMDVEATRGVISASQPVSGWHARLHPIMSCHPWWPGCNYEINKVGVAFWSVSVLKPPHPPSCWMLTAAPSQLQAVHSSPKVSASEKELHQKPAMQCTPITKKKRKCNVLVWVGYMEKEETFSFVKSLDDDPKFCFIWHLNKGLLDM